MTKYSMSNAIPSAPVCCILNDRFLKYLRMFATERPYTQNFFKIQYIIIQAILGRKSMKKFAVTNKNIFRVYKAFDRKK